MKILYHHRTRAEDAQGIHISEIINSFKELGHEVKVAGIVSGQGNDTASSSFLSQVAGKAPALLYEFMEIFYNIYGFYKLRKQILSFQPDFIYERYALFTFAGVLASKIYKIPLIEEVNAPLSMEKGIYSKLVFKKFASWCEKKICANAWKTIVVSTPLKEIIKELGVADDKLVVVPNGVNPDQFNPSIDPGRIREKYGLEGKKVLGFVGWFRKWHGLENLLEIYARKEMIKNNIHILLVGDGPAYDDLYEIAKKNDILNTGVTFTGSVERQKIPEFISAFDAALQPDVTDYASPIKLFEYISMGKGVVAPDKPNIKELLGVDYPGLFKAGDWESMGDKMFQCLETREKTVLLGQISYELFLEKKFYWKENARRTIRLLNT